MVRLLGGLLLLLLVRRLLEGLLLLWQLGVMRVAVRPGLWMVERCCEGGGSTTGP